MRVTQSFVLSVLNLQIVSMSIFYFFVFLVIALTFYFTTEMEFRLFGQFKQEIDSSKLGEKLLIIKFII